MLVIASDLHLTDGTSGTTISPNAFAIFHERLRDLAFAASDQDIGEQRVYKPISELHLLLVGDILDVIRSTKWLTGDIRPWDDPQTPAFIEKVHEITEAILANNAAAAATLRCLRSVEIPEAIGATKCAKVTVHKHYVVGNHDWFYHLSGPRFDAIRASIVTTLGLANDPAKPFPHEVEESPAILKICEDHRVYARHGDIHDSRNYERQTRDRSSIGDAIVIELLDRFTETVRKELGGRGPKELCEIDNVRPMELIPVWLDGLLKQSADPEAARAVRRIWDGVVEDFLDIDFVKRHRDPFKWGLRLTEGFSFSNLGRIVPWGARMVRRLGLMADYAKFARREKAFADPKYSYVVFGHTHHHEVVPLRTAARGGGPEGIYLNSGTWRAVFDRAKDGDFFGYRVMTYLAFFNGSERHGSSFEAWSASLEYPEMNPGLTRAPAVTAVAPSVVTSKP
jgi:hypothetical protein